MAAITMSPNQIDVVALSATPSVAQEYAFDANVRRIEVRFTDGAGTSVAGAYSLTGTDGGAQVTDAITIFAGTAEVVQLAGIARNLGGTSVFVSSPTASAVVEIRTYGVNRAS